MHMRQPKQESESMADQSPFENLTHRILELEQESAALRQKIEQVQRAETRFRMMIENVPDLIWSMSMDTMQIDYISPSVVSMLGYSREEALTKLLLRRLTSTVSGAPWQVKVQPG